MMNLCYFIYCTVIFMLLESIYCQHEIGDHCTIQRTGLSGQCQLLQNCPPAIQALQSQGIYPQKCGFQGAQPIVCCVGSTPITKPTPATITTNPTRPVPVTRPTVPSTVQPITPSRKPGPLRVGDKSREKCREYGKYVYTSPVAGGALAEDCAVTDVQLIVGGEKAKPKEFPHMALIGFDGENNEKKWQCGGSLISDLFILTAAHCLYDQQFGEPKYVRVGDLVINDNSDDAEPQNFNIIERIRHPSYRPPSQYNDIALLKLDRRVQLSSYARPICLETNPSLNLTRKPLASGWGKVGFSSDTSEALLKVTLEYFTHAECAHAYRNNIGIRLRNGILDETQVCAGSHSESKDTCQGDSGGPLQIGNKDVFCTYKIVGVTSFGKVCGTANIPGVYTRVSNYIEWIEGIVWP